MSELKDFIHSRVPPVEWVVTTWDVDEDGDDEWTEHNKRIMEEMMQPGRVLLMEDGSIELVGTVNEQRGGCSCCQVFNRTHVAGWANLFELLGDGRQGD